MKQSNKRRKRTREQERERRAKNKLSLSAPLYEHPAWIKMRKELDEERERSGIPPSTLFEEDEAEEKS